MSAPRTPHKLDSLLSETQAYWQLGEWKRLSLLDFDDYSGRKDRLAFALMRGVSLLQLGQRMEAHDCLSGAIKRGAHKKDISRMLISGALNSLGRASILAGRYAEAKGLFSRSLSEVEPYVTNLMVTARLGVQTYQLTTEVREVREVGSVALRESVEDIYKRKREKISDKWSSYLKLYDDLLISYQNENVRILEIGVQNGGSLEAWSDYFKKAKTIIGCDIVEKCGELQFSNKNIKVVVGDSAHYETKNRILKENDDEGFDIIIDDGSHISSSCIKNFIQYFPILNVGGIYIVEDVHCSYWEDFEGGLFHPESTMTFFKRIADIVNFEHWNNALSLESYFDDFDKLDFGSLREIFSVAFFNSVVVLWKRSREQCELGRRVVVGEEGLVTGTATLAADGSRIKVRDQRSNPNALFGSKGDVCEKHST